MGKAQDNNSILKKGGKQRIMQKTKRLVGKRYLNLKNIPQVLDNIFKSSLQ